MKSAQWLECFEEIVKGGKFAPKGILGRPGDDLQADVRESEAPLGPTENL